VVEGPAARRDFRSDINGLRAISIALVVAYHLGGGLAPGGFIGVDVFFVISGFLMTNIIAGRLRENRFGLLDFYAARLRRIWPALAALCAALTLAGCLALDPWTYQRLAADVPATLLFGSNLLFAARQGYFATDERDNWLLHTWSLSVEWQFYLLYPLLLIGLFAMPTLRRSLWPTIGALTVGSFVLAVVFSARGQGWTFYELPTRAWELLAGALCSGAGAVRLSGVWRALLHSAGLALIGLGAWLAEPAAGWPSALALLPVGGAALVIVGDLRRSFWAETALVAAVGRASYSIYIWHWPVLVALRYAGVTMTPEATVCAVAAMLTLGFASYWLIEQTATRWLFGAPLRRWGLLGAGALVGALAFAGGVTRGFEALRTAGASPAERAALADDRAASDDWAYPKVCGALVKVGDIKLCRLGDPAARRVLVIGDSHAEQFAPRYAHAFDGKAGDGITFVTAGGCAPIPGVGLRHRGPGCARWARAAFRYAETAGFSRVAIVSTWQQYFDSGPGAPDGIACLAAGDACGPSARPPNELATGAFDRLTGAIRRLQSRGIDVVIFGPAPRSPAADPMQLYRQTFWTQDLSPKFLERPAADRLVGLSRAGLTNVSRACGVPLVDPFTALCTPSVCPVSDGARTLYKDANHVRASAVAGPRFAYLDAWLTPAGLPISGEPTPSSSGAWTPGKASP
jgi:peptidoglycan/LPS O-acetylase OafA/YrhL